MHLMGHRSTNQHLRYTKLFFFSNVHANTNNLSHISWKLEQFWILTPCTNLKCPLTYNLMYSNLKTKHRRCIKLHFRNPYHKTNNLALFSENKSCFNFWPKLNSQGQDLRRHSLPDETGVCLVHVPRQSRVIRYICTFQKNRGSFSRELE